MAKRKQRRNDIRITVDPVHHTTTVTELTPVVKSIERCTGHIERELKTFMASADRHRILFAVIEWAEGFLPHTDCPPEESTH